MDRNIIKEKYISLKGLIEGLIKRKRISFNDYFVLERKKNEFRISKGGDSNSDKSFADELRGFGGSYKNAGTSYWENWVYDFYVEPSCIFRLCLLNRLYPSDFEENNVKWYRFFVDAVDQNLILNDGSVNDAINGAMHKLDDLLIKHGLINEDVISANRIKVLLNCDHERIGIPPYEEKMVTNPNQGHWDITEQIKANGKTYYPRDPKLDIRDGVVVGIDFGTKSTIVYYQDENGISLPMPVGDDGSLNQSSQRYENPTVMCFSSWKDFKQAYYASKGRPETHWNDLNVSHIAKKNYKEANSDQFNAYLNDIKQWAGGREREITIQPLHQEEDEVLKPFLEIEEEDLNPIEYYAYLIGVNINNMIHGIHLNYYLSFPVSYENKIKNKVRESFEKGLKKSLPTAILNDKQLMNDFYVNGDISEPLAYATCVLQKYNFSNEEEGSINYAIFDFGGGTTDFDFGVWSVSAKRKYNFEIQTFGGTGLAQMGGENLLEDLAFEIFRNNKEVLIKTENNKTYKYQFRKGPNSKSFLGDDIYVSNQSPEADKNMHIMIEALRDYWEKSEEMLENSNDEEDVVSFKDLQFVDTNGSLKEGLDIKIKKSEIKQFFIDNIRDAILNFFSALDKVKDKYSGSDVKIFLAGNSCKSPYVSQLFDEIIDTRDDGNEYEIFPPLGTEESIAIIKKRGGDLEDLPTGKTGVAYGLIECRKGGKIDIGRAAIPETPVNENFAYYLGYEKMGKFILIPEDGGFGKLEVGTWCEFMEVESEDDVVEIYYTDKPEATSNELPIKGIRQKTLKFEKATEDGYVYIRAIDPHTLEYVVSDVMPDENYKGKLYTQKF
ncbi:MAG: hypothetical protein MJZ41_05115 [Bacteroidaceae bacterium]|nr:hypothetical protein [Bacteroidaceae bacterium]